MVRPRNALLAFFPPGSFTATEASDALRRSNGDVDIARRYLSERVSSSCSSSSSLCGAGVAGDVSSKRKIAKAQGATATRTVQRNGNVKKRQLQQHRQQQGEENERAAPTAAARGTSTSDDDPSSPQRRLPPRHVAPINNLSDAQYCCVWGVEVYEDGYRPEMARYLLATVARHVNPILRCRGWRVKRLIESASTQWVGLCTANGRNDADAASTNIQLNLRVRPDRHCTQFRTFQQILGVMLHEITHTSIGLEDIHPPAFYELLSEIKEQYRRKLRDGDVEREPDECYGCGDRVVTASGAFKTVREAAGDLARVPGGRVLGVGGGVEGDAQQPLLKEEECGASKRRRGRGRRRRRGGGGDGNGGKRRAFARGYTSNVPGRRPLLKGARMIDGRTREGKAAAAEKASLNPRELAARAALARFRQSKDEGVGGFIEDDEEEDADFLDDGDGSDGGVSVDDNEGVGDGSEEELEDDEDGEDSISPHDQGCGCRGCGWDKMLFLPLPDMRGKETRRKGSEDHL